MIKIPLIWAVFLLHVTAVMGQQYTTQSFSVKISSSGHVISLKNRNQEYAAADEPGSLLQLVVNGKNLAPVNATFNRGSITLSYADGYTARLKVQSKTSYIVFTLADISKGIDAVKWGPFNTNISDTIGNTVGVVRSGSFAIGLQCLNKKTSGGELVNKEGAVFSLGTTAIAQRFGSSLQAFSVNRSQDRMIKVWDRWPDVPVKGIPDGKLEGSSIALFGCVPTDVLSVLETITIQEGLPYAKWKGTWIKRSEESGKSYMITTFTENNIDTFLTYAKRLGMAGVYHEDPFESWGHFELKKSLFPQGRKGFKDCVDKAHSMGLRMGFHTLTTFITTNDSFVSPKPDHRLAQAGHALLISDLSADATELIISSDKYFRLRSDLNSVRIGDEIIRFLEVTSEAPYRLTGCVRGAFGTRKAAHKASEQVARLIDHPYKVFFPNWDLQKDIATNIARFMNETGADQMDFDGHEGTYACGMGDLSFNSFAEEVLNQTNHPVVFGSSRDNHHFWHMNSYLNWGEPWYGGFRESQLDVRMAYQPFYQNNYLPNMLGWFLITAQTRADDIDWMLARAAGFDAGYALVLRKEALVNPEMDDIISRINTWTSAQRNHLFSAEEKQWLRNPANDARLLNRNGNVFLQRFKKFEFEYLASVLQPGQPTAHSWDFENTHEDQIPQIIAHASGENGQLVNPIIELDNFYHIEIPITIEAGQTLMLGTQKTANLYDSKGRLIRSVPIARSLPSLGTGRHSLSFDGKADANFPLTLKVEIKLLSNEELLRQ